MRRQALPGKNLFKFFSETIVELKKVVWPTRREALNLTIVVVIASVAMGAILGLFDLFFTELIDLLIR